jgi:hypothetical protein
MEDNFNILLIALGLSTVIVFIGVAMKKWIFFDSESDFFATLGLLVTVVIDFALIGMLDESQTYELTGKVFFWLGLAGSSILTVIFGVTTYSSSISGNGLFIGTFLYVYKLVFCLVLAAVVMGKIGEITNNKDRRTRANKAPILAIFALLALFWNPLKRFLINGDSVREHRGIAIQSED